MNTVRYSCNQQNFSSLSVHFITICTDEKQNLLWNKNLPAETVTRDILSEYGIIVDREILHISKVYDDVSVDKYVIMPNHVHMIILRDINGLASPEIPRLIQQFKTSITRQTHSKIWKSSFYNRILPSFDIYLKKCRHISDNPSNLLNDKFYMP